MSRRGCPGAVWGGRRPARRERRRPEGRPLVLGAVVLPDADGGAHGDLDGAFDAFSSSLRATTCGASSTPAPSCCPACSRSGQQRRQASELARRPRRRLGWQGGGACARPRTRRSTRVCRRRGPAAARGSARPAANMTGALRAGARRQRARVGVNAGDVPPPWTAGCPGVTGRRPRRAPATASTRTTTTPRTAARRGSRPSPRGSRAERGAAPPARRRGVRRRRAGRPDEGRVRVRRQPDL